VGIDRSDDGDAAVPPDQPADRVPSAGDRADQPAQVPAETRYRDEYYEVLHALDKQSEAGEPARNAQETETADLDTGSAVDKGGPSGERSEAVEAAEDDEQTKAADLGAATAAEEWTPAEVGESAGEDADAPQVGAAAITGEQAPSEEQPEQGRQRKAGEPTENGQDVQASQWSEKAELSRWMWGKYLEKWPPEERPPVDKSGDPEGSWRADSVRYLSPADNAEVEQECDVIADREDKIISPKLREVESCDPDRQLIGFDHRLKGRDRIKEKVYDDMDLLGNSAGQAISLLPDAIRYTFEYDEARYAQGVQADIARMKEQGFKLEVLKNFWSDDQYKGINSQWIEPETGQRFEMQFHTRISAEAKEITHKAYERLRSDQADAFEELVLEAFQRKVSADIPVPIGATGIPDYPEKEEQHA
jgi:hypothetical protein